MNMHVCEDIKIKLVFFYVRYISNNIFNGDAHNFIAAVIFT